MATALQHALYNQHVGVDYLSRNVESNVLHAPEVLDRLSISQKHFDTYKTRTYRPPHVPWGRSLSYGGTGPINLPEEHRPRHEPPTRVQKGHRHYGGGVVPIPCTLPVQQYYDLTLLKRSNLRRNDELIPDPHKINIGKLAIQLKFPAEHPYHSHIPKCAVFPNFDSPDDVRKGKHAVMTSSTLPPTAAASAPDPIVVHKTKGNFAREEVVQVQKESGKDPLIWNEHNYHQLLKGPGVERQNYYPTPPSSLDPNSWKRSAEMTVSPRTANALYNLQKSYWRTVYNQQYTGNGPQNILKLDNYDDVCRGGGDHLKEHFKSEPLPPRPLEGRHTNVRNTLKIKKKKRVIVGHGTELWVTDDEDDEPTARPQRTNNNTVDIKSKLDTRYKLDASKQEVKAEQDDDREPGTYSKNVHHLINNEHISYELDTTKKINNYYQAAHPPEISPFLDSLEKSRSYNYNQRPSTAPQPARPRSPTIYNMPSQVHEQTMTGSTNSDLYPKWFRQTSKYEKRPSTALLELQNSWSRTEAHRKFHEQFPENAPDIRQKPDLRITTNERRHVIPETGIHVYYYHR